MSSTLYRPPVNHERPRSLWRKFLLIVAATVTGGLILMGILATVAVATVPSSPSPAPVAKSVPAPVHHRHHHRHHHYHPAAPAPATVPAPTIAPNPDANSTAVVTQFYQDLTNHDYADAWVLGGDNIGGTDYNSWVAGYDTTASITLGTVSYFNSTEVQAEIIATQDNGLVKTYSGTYTVISGVITAANIAQTT